MNEIETLVDKNIGTMVELSEELKKLDETNKDIIRNLREINLILGISTE